MVKNERQRYIFFKLLKSNEIHISQEELLKTIWQSIWRYFGMKEANKIGLWMIEFDNQYGIIRCSHHTKDLLITALSMIRDINGTRIIISPIKTSGTIKKIKYIKNTLINENNLE